MQQANATTTSGASAETPHARARDRAQLYAQIARHRLIAARHHRIEGRAAWSRDCLASAGAARRLACSELNAAREIAL